MILAYSCTAKDAKDAKDAKEKQQSKTDSFPFLGGRLGWGCDARTGRKV
jgi:hypothetical protein